jgi:hypothetical protein
MPDRMPLDTFGQIAAAGAVVLDLRAQIERQGTPLSAADQRLVLDIAHAALLRVAPRIDLVDDHEVPAWLRRLHDPQQES